MFENKSFQSYDFGHVPINCDCYLMDEDYLQAYEQYMLRVIAGNSNDEEPIGETACAAIRKIHNSSMNLSWYPNNLYRFHEVSITLNKSDFITCVSSYNWDEKPHLFIKRGWLNRLYLRHYSVFGLIDAVGMKTALDNGSITKERLAKLRDSIDHLSESRSEMSFISFADSVLVKSNWSVGYVSKNVHDTYNPEIMLSIVKDLHSIFNATLGLSVYAVLTQGYNEYSDDPVFHISSSKNHISMNSLGLPFAQLFAIDGAAKDNVQKMMHLPKEVYMDEHFFHSLRFKSGFKKDVGITRYKYLEPMNNRLLYYYAGHLQELIENLDLSESTSK